MDEETREYIARLEAALVQSEGDKRVLVGLLTTAVQQLTSMNTALEQLRVRQEEILAVVAASDGQTVWDFRRATNLS